MKPRLLVLTAALVLVLAACGGDDGGDVTTPEPDDATGETTPAPDETETPDAAETPEDTETPEDDAATEDDPATGGDAAGAEPVTRAVDATLDQGSATFETTVDIETDELSDSAVAGGVVDFDGDRRQLEVDSPAGPVQSLITSDGIHLSIGGQAGWLRVDPRDLRGTPLEAYGVATLPLQDPSVNLALLRGATDDVEELGEETVDGDPARHYRVTVDVDDAASQADEQARNAVSAVAEQTGTDTVDMQVWIDDEDLIRRVHRTVDLAEADVVGAETGASGTVDVTVDLSDFGAAVDIAEPDEAEVVDVDEETFEQLVRDLTATG